MNVNELLDTIEDALEEGANVPLSGGKKIVDVEQIRDYLDEIRANLPGELRQAQQIVNDRAQIVDSANAQAQAIVKKAEERARILVSDAEIVKAAQQRASEITSAAQTEARTLRQTVTDYCENMLRTTEDTMVENAAQVKNIRNRTPRKTADNGQLSTQIPHIAENAVPVSKNDGSQGLFLWIFAAKSRPKTLAFTGLICYNKHVSVGQSG